MMQNIIIVGMGGFFGAVARFVIGLWVGQKWGRSFPLGTFFVNVSGSFFIGFLMALFTERLMLNPQWRTFFVIGFLGAYTTFSTFEYETGALIRDSEWLIAALNVVLSVIMGFGALKLGEGAARIF
jgi:fluoride exporter